MKQAGLTVGVFYKHFGSRDDLLAQALGSAVGPWKGLVDAAASGGPPVTYDALVDAYLSVLMVSNLIHEASPITSGTTLFPRVTTLGDY
jgi:AcrR family transcriptional regulator